MIRYDEEREEVIRKFKKAEPKIKKPKADHKHEYEKVLEEQPAGFYIINKNPNYVIKCKICGRIK